MRRLLVANWKENPASEVKALALFDATAKARRQPNVEVAICPPFLYLEEIAKRFRGTRPSARKNLALGAQDVFWREKGAYTSEVGPRMIRALGARYVIIGHSERRKYLHETDAMINRKITLALKDGLDVILCVGEPLAIRKRGVVAAKQCIKNQLKRDLTGVKKAAGVNRGRISGLSIAYEPIWAIGTGRNDKPEDAVEMARFIKRGLTGAVFRGIRFLYGGSTNSKNIRDYVQYKEIDGALVGGASLKTGEFAKMIAAVGDKSK